MSWVRVGGVQANRANLPVTSLDVHLLHSVEVGDLVVVGVVTDAHQDSFALGDNSPSRSNHYSMDMIGDNPPGTATVAICWAVMTEQVLSLVVTVANGDGGSNRIGGIIAGYRESAQIAIDGSAGDLGTGSAFGPTSIGFDNQDELVVAVVLAEPPSFTTTFAPPLSLRRSVFPGTTISGHYADGVFNSRAARVAGVFSVSADWAQGVVFYSIDTPLPSNPPSSSFSGGTQPAPMYYKQEGGPILSRPLRRRLRSEHLHV